MAGLSLSAVFRLAQAWATVDRKSLAALEDLRRLMNAKRNSKALRDALHAVNPPCLPYLCVSAAVGALVWWFLFIILRKVRKRGGGGDK